MAGLWIKMRTDIQNDPAVIHLGVILGLDSYAVIGRLAAVWMWADTHADRHGRVTLVSRDCLDSITQCEGFGAALESVGWLVSAASEGGGITFPRFDRHMGEGAKARALAAKRKQNQRERESAKGHGGVPKASRTERDNTVTRVEKRRVEKKEEEIPPLPPAEPGGTSTAPIPDSLGAPEFREAWAAWLLKKRGAKLKPDSQAMQLKKLAEIGPAAAVLCIESSLMNQYQGLFPDKFKGQSHGTKSGGAVGRSGRAVAPEGKYDALDGQTGLASRAPATLPFPGGGGGSESRAG